MSQISSKPVAIPDPSISQATADRLLEKAADSGRDDLKEVLNDRLANPEAQAGIGQSIDTVNPGEQVLKPSERGLNLEHGSMKQMAYEGGKAVAIGAVTVANPVAGRLLYAADKVGLVNKALGVKEQQKALASQNDPVTQGPVVGRRDEELEEEYGPRPG